jgi:hypothetical protein
MFPAAGDFSLRGMSQALTKDGSRALCYIRHPARNTKLQVGLLTRLGLLRQSGVETSRHAEEP